MIPRTVQEGIRLRAVGRCERCRCDGDVVVRGEYDDAGTYMLERGEVFDASTGQYLGMARGSEYEGTLQATRLRVVRVDADGGDEPDNLLLLCRWCSAVDLLGGRP